ncbi:aspartyl/asparaginyl beta-hydroxylase domain-containing protein [Mycolicibacterium vaccae]|nr:aspartyl/asparaginyl beta-hydroxylase domain-containing protein [Mycolicibacterium vaccae]
MGRGRGCCVTTSLSAPRHDETLTRIRVGSSTQHWRKGRSMVFDDTFEHEVWNDSEETRVVLFVDFIRELPWYLAIPNRAFIGAIRRSPYIRRALANSEAWQETLGAQVTADTGSTQPGTLTGSRASTWARCCR